MRRLEAATRAILLATLATTLTACATRPSPSLNVQNARAPPAASRTSHIGIDALTTPAIGPTVLRAWPRPPHVILHPGAPASRVS